MKKTSIYIETYLWKKLASAQKRANVSKRAIINWLILNHLNTEPKQACLGKKMTNRSRKPKGFRIIQTIDLQAETYDCCMDLRKVYLTSISAIIAEGIIRHLDQCIRSLSRTKTKITTYTEYLFCCNKNGKRLHYQVFTYLPEQLDAILSPG